MRLQAKQSTKKWNICLHLFLVVGVFLYLYSPFLDHWLGNGFYVRPHTHAHISEEMMSQVSLHGETDSFGVAGEHEEEEENVLCSLDIQALLSLLLPFNMVSQTQLARDSSLVMKAVSFYWEVSIIYLSSLDPPPNI